MLDLMEIMRANGYFVSGINAANHNNDLHKVLGGSLTTDNNTHKMIVIDNFDMAKVNNDRIAEIQKEINELLTKKSIVVVLVTSTHILRLINDGFRLISAFASLKMKSIVWGEENNNNIWSKILPVALTFPPPMGIAIGEIGVASLLYKWEKNRKFLMINGNTFEYLDFFENQNRERISCLIADIFFESENYSLMEKGDIPGKEYLIALEILDVDIHRNYFLKKWLQKSLNSKISIDYLCVKDNKESFKKIIDNCLLAYLYENFLKYLAIEHT